MNSNKKFSPHDYYIKLANKKKDNPQAYSFKINRVIS